MEPIKAYRIRIPAERGKLVECSLYGGPAEHWRYMKSAGAFDSGSYESALSEALDGVKDGENRLLLSIGHPDAETRVLYSRELIADLWRADRGLGPYPLLELLGDYERDGVYYYKYREHLAHQVRVWLLGLYLLHRVDVIRWALLKEIKEDLNRGEALTKLQLNSEMLRRWKIAALWHDIGYVFEVQNSGEAAELIKKSLNALNNTYSAPISELTAGNSCGISLELEREIQNQAEYGFPSWKYLSNFDALVSGRHRKLWSKFKREGSGACLVGDADPSGGLKVYFEMCRNKSFSKTAGMRPGFIDHGIAGALTLLRIHEFMQHYVKALHEFLMEEPELSDENQKKEAEGILQATNSAVKTVRAAAGAIALHNIHPGLPEPNTAATVGLTLNKYKIRLTEKNDRPGTALAYLLGLSDGLQEWDRPHFRLVRDKRDLTLIDQHIEVTADDRAVYLQYFTGDDSFDDYKKARENLGQYLDRIRGDNALLREGRIERLANDLPEEAQPAAVARLDDYDLEPYLKIILRECGTITLRGIMAAGKSREALEIPIQDIYAPLRIEGGGTDEQMWRLIAGVKDDVREHKGRTELMRTAEPIEDEGGDDDDNDTKRQGLLLIGDPDSGKSTFLRLTAAVIARALMKKTGAEEHPAVKILSGDNDKLPLPLYLRLSEFVTFMRDNQGIAVPGSPGWLEEYLRQWHEQFGSGIAWEAFRKKMEEGGVLLLLDGLDEIPGSVERQKAAAALKSALSENKYGKCRVCIASRPMNEYDLDLPLASRKLDGLSDRAIEEFLKCWGSKVTLDEAGRFTTPEEYTEDLMGAAKKADVAIRRMLRNPLMLTCLAVIHWNERRLPQQRAELFDAVIAWLLRARRPIEAGMPQLSEHEARRAYQLLAIAMQMHPGGRIREIDLVEAAEKIAECFKGDNDEIKRFKACRFLEAEVINTGIVTMRGDKRISFWHLSFQEFLAADYLCEAPDKMWKEILNQKRLFEREQREVVLLLGGLMKGGPRTNELLRHILQTPKSGKLADKAREYGLAGAVIEDVKPYGFKPDAKLDIEGLKQDVMQIFTVEAAGIPLKTRVEAAEALGQTGDPRLKEDNWVEIEEGGFWMAKYPVTVQEYEAFVEDGGYDPDGFGKKWLPEWKKAFDQFLAYEKLRERYSWIKDDDFQRQKPHDWEKQLLYYNRPVVDITWFEAMAYCRWFTEKQKDGWKYTLPDEKQWEKAAMGKKGRGRYPWGDDPPGEGDQARANYDGAGIGHPSPVGLFPTGTSKWGEKGELFDMSGNVWEWCVDTLSESGYKSVGGSYRPLRGGSYWNDADNVEVRNRNRNVAVNRNDNNGFRLCCVSVPAQHAKR